MNETRDFSQVLEKRDENGNLLVRYVYGHDLISQTRDGVTSYYHYDGLGSTRALTASSAVVTDTYNYDAFGVILKQTGTTENHYLYRGERFDPELGFYYLRARYMDPNVGRFVTMDPFSGLSQDPYSLHKYLYANANPIAYSDPSGNFSITEIQVGTLIRGILSRSDTLAKVATYKKTIGMLGGALINAFDTWLGGGTWNEVLLNGAIGGASGAAGMAIGGRIAPIICKFKYLAPILGTIGLGAELKGVKESLDKGEYEQAAFRAFLAMFTFRSTIHAWKTAACFTQDTLIYTEEGHRPIKDIQVGDNVYAENIETGEKGFKRVKKVFTRETTVLIYLFVDGGEIKTTLNHPFWVLGKGWVPAGELRVGEDVKFFSGEHKKITGIRQEVLTQPLIVYNFEVEDWHTYFVGKRSILVHNAKCPNPYGKKGKPAHQRKIQKVVEDLKNQGFKVEVEEGFKIPVGGHKSKRYADIYVMDPNTGEEWTIQVGKEIKKGPKKGLPVARERRAQEDLELAGYLVEFIPYN